MASTRTEQRLQGELKVRRRQQGRLRGRLMAIRRRINRLKAGIARRRQSPRDRAVAFAKTFVGVTESPPGSNKGGIITVWQQRLGSWLVGTAWCGTFCANMLLHVGVKGVNWRLASVANIEDDAKAGRGPFRGWTVSAAGAQRGDLVVLFGRGVHVEMVDRIDTKLGVCYTIGGNTSSGNFGSQSNGGGVFTRVRNLSDVRGFALVRFP